MKKLLNTLFITSENAKLSLEGETVVVTLNKTKIGQFPLHTLQNIICFSYAGATPAFMGTCADRGCNLSFFSPYGRFLCRVTGASNGNVLLRRQQYRVADVEEFSCNIARNMISGKVFNCRWSIDRTVRDHPLRVDVEKCKNSERILQDILEQMRNSVELDSLRGLEGEAAAAYFKVFPDLILNQKEDFCFNGRNRRPPLDRVNAMLSFGYSLLANDCAAALEGVGLDAYVGFMHQDRPGRKSLALDLMEELRAIIVDRFVITMINNRQIHGSDFITLDTGAVIFTDDGKKTFLAAWQNHKKEQLVHPYIKEKLPWGLVPHVQAMLLARFLRGDIDGYPPFLWR